MSEPNTLEENKTLIRRWFEEVWNKGRADAIAEIMAEDAVAHGLSEDAAKPLRGPAGFLPFHAQFRAKPFPTSKSSSKTLLPKATKWWPVAQSEVSMSATAWDLSRPELRSSSTASPSSKLRTVSSSKPGTTLIL
jgi:hypothetical protein